MSRFQFYGPKDTPDTSSGDAAWLGIDMTGQRETLQPGMLSLGENTRTHTRRVQQRRGTTIPGDFNPVLGFTNFLVGSGVFRNPNGNEVLMIAPADVQYTLAFQYGKDAVRIDYSAAEIATLRTNGIVHCEFVQSFEKLSLLRYISASVNLIWDGINGTDWEQIALSSTGLTLVPARINGEPFMDRVVYYNSNWPVVPLRDEWLVSDIEDYTSYDTAYQVFRTNSAESDYITRILSYFKSSVVIFKNQSIHMRTLFPAVPLQSAERVLSSVIGSIGNKMPLPIGGDVIFLSQPNGFYRLSEVIQDQISTQPVPISERIQRVIDDINWPVTAAIGCSQALGRFAFFGVARGAAPRGLNCILVFDSQENQWVSAGDTWADPTFSFWALHITNYNGVQRLFAVDYPNAVVYLLYEGVNDEMQGGEFQVPFKMETRGYIGDDAIKFKKFGMCNIGISTYMPSVNVTAITDGFNEEKLLTIEPLTKDRTRFYQHGHADFNPLTDNFDEIKREDYSVVSIDNFAGEDFEDLPVGPIFRLPGTSPAVAGDQQESVEPFIVRSFGRWLSLRIENTQGVCEVTSVGVESTPAMRTGRTAA